MTDSSPVSRKLFGGLIDYAGVFPPADLGLAEALRLYRRAADGTHGWMLGPCLVTAGHLGRLPPGRTAPFLAVVLDHPARQVGARRDIRWIETPVSAEAAGEQVRSAAAKSPVVYAESPDPAHPAYLGTLAALRGEGLDARAKIRTGGSGPRSFPSVERLARFIESALALGVPFKATAGLHHPIRRPSRPDGATEHGFINLLAAVRAALAGDGDAARGALRESDPGRFDPHSAVWRGVGRGIDPGAVRRVFRSFGSCSFDGPARRLHRLGAPAGGAGR